MPNRKCDCHYSLCKAGIPTTYVESHGLRHQLLFLFEEALRSDFVTELSICFILPTLNCYPTSAKHTPVRPTKKFLPPTRGAGRSHQPPAASQPAPKEQWLGLGPVSLHIRSRRYINGTCLETAQLNSSNQTLREEKGARKKKQRFSKEQDMVSESQIQECAHATLRIHTSIASFPTPASKR